MTDEWDEKALKGKGFGRGTYANTIPINARLKISNGYNNSKDAERNLDSDSAWQESFASSENQGSEQDDKELSPKKRQNKPIKGRGNVKGNPNNFNDRGSYKGQSTSFEKNQYKDYEKREPAKKFSHDYRKKEINDNKNDHNEFSQQSTSNDKFTKDKPKEFYIPPEPSNDERELFTAGVSAGINFNNYDQIPIKISGENLPKAIDSFKSCYLNSILLENVQRSGYNIPTPIQKNAIPIIMNDRDLMACAQTGSGKTAAFLLPIINALLNGSEHVTPGRPQVLIISPTRELCIQIFNEARKFSISTHLKICLAYGGTATKYQSDNIGKGCHILVATPGRLLDFVDKSYITFENIQFIVLDEADRMLDMGFLPSVETVMGHPTLKVQANRQTLMFSATFPEEIQRLAGKFLNNYVFLSIGIIGGACADVEQNFYKVTKFDKRKKLMEIIDNGNSKGIMVFVETKRNADFLASFLSETKYPTTSIHGDRLQREREEALRDFKSGQMHILIATSVAARGLDIKNVSHVINYDLPKSIDEYVHRIGRTGRVGNRGKATSFYDETQDSQLIPDLVKILQQAGQQIPDFLKESSGTLTNNYNKQQQFGGHDVRHEDELTDVNHSESSAWSNN